MIKYLLYLLFVSLLFFVSCAKKECCDFPVYKDFMLAQKDGVAWTGDPSNSILKQDTVILLGNSAVAGQQEALSFKIRLDGLGFYALKNDEGYYHVFKGDAVVSRYKLSPTHHNTVTVFAYNESGKIIQGFFDLKFVKDFDNPAGSQPDSIGFLDGKFKVALHN